MILVPLKYIKNKLKKANKILRTIKSILMSKKNE